MNPENPIETLRPKMLYEALADAIREQIFRHQLMPGAPLDEFQLAKNYVVSRTPIREALKVLASEGIVELQARRGCFVVRLDWDDILQLFDLLELLEDFAVREVAQARATLSPGPAFWRELASASGNSFLSGLMERLVAKLRLAFGPQFEGPEMQPSLSCQSALAQALAAGDTGLARKLLADQGKTRRHNGRQLFAQVSQHLAATQETQPRQSTERRLTACARETFSAAGV